MKRVIIFILIFLLLLVMAILLYKSLNKDKTFVPDKMIGKEFPLIQSESLLNSKIINSDQVLKGKKYYLINIWSSWCAPCREEHPLLLKLANESNLKMIGINFKDNKKNAISFLNDYGNPFSEIFIDSKGNLSINIGSYGIPETILINKKHVIVFKFTGPIDLKEYKILKNFINKL